MTTLNPDKEQFNRTPVPGSRLSNRSKYSNASRSVKGEGQCMNNVLLETIDNYGVQDVQQAPLQQKYRTAAKKHVHSKKRSM